MYQRSKFFLKSKINLVSFGAIGLGIIEVLENLADVSFIPLSWKLFVVTTVLPILTILFRTTDADPKPLHIVTPVVDDHFTR